MASCSYSGLTMNRSEAVELLNQFVVYLDEEDYASIPKSEIDQFLDDTAAEV